MFGQIAPCYDFLNHLLSLNIDRRWRRTTARLVPAGPPELGPVLDLCTGTGDLALTYDAATGGTVPVVGADFCHEMLRRAVEKARAAGAAGRVRLVEARAERLRGHGLVDVRYEPLTFGVATLYVGVKPARL